LRPPSLADWLLILLAPRRIRDAVLGDLREEYSRYAVAERGPTRARLWYWKQVLGVLSHYRSPLRVLAPWAHECVARQTGLLARALAAGAVALRLSRGSLRRDRAFAAVAVLMLAVGIGSGATAFTLVRGVLVQSLPYENPERLVEVGGRLPGVLGRDVAASPPEYRDYLLRATSLEDLAATLSLGATAIHRGRAVPVQAVLTTPNLFSLLGVSPAMGRDFETGDASGAVGDVAIISYDAWLEFFSGEPRALGRTLRVDGDQVTVIGVMGRDFRHPGASEERPVQLWMPMSVAEGTPLDRRGARVLTALGRIRDGSSLSDTRAQLGGVARELQRSHPEYYPPNSGWDVVAIPLTRVVVGAARATLLLFAGAAGLVLLVACAVVANLLVSRGARSLRSGERGRRTAGLLVAGEGFVLAAAGAVLALPLAWLGTELTTHAAAGEVPRLAGVHFDDVAVWYTAGASLLVLVACAVAPVARLLVAERSRIPRCGTAAPWPSRDRLHNALAGGPLAAALILCIAAGLMARSLQRLADVHPGFESDGVLTLKSRLPVPNDPRTGRYFEPGRRIAFFDRALEEMRAIPNVVAAGVVSHLPMRERNGWTFGIVGAECRPREGLPTLEFRVASPSYFEVMRIGLLRGRHLAESDDRRNRYVVTVNQALVARHFPDRDPIGQRLVLGGPDGRVAEIVGVVEDVRDSSLDADPRPTAYASYRQNVGAEMTFVLRTGTRPEESIAAAAADALGRVDDDVPVFAVEAMRDVVTRTLAQRRLLTRLLALLGALAVVLSGAGVRSAVAAAVEEECGVGGAHSAPVPDARRGRLATALRYGMRIAIPGVGMGMLGAAGGAGLLARSWPEIGWLDPVVYGAGAGLFFGVAIAAALVSVSAGPRHGGADLVGQLASP